MTPPADPATRLAQEAARRGCTVEQLLDRLDGLPRLETVAGFLPHYLAGLSPDTAKRYATPLLMVRDGWSVPPEHVDLVVDLARQQDLDLDPAAMPPSPRLPRPRKATGTPKGAATHRLVVAGCGDTPIQEMTTTQLRVLRKYISVRARLRQHLIGEKRRREGRVVHHYDGRGAEETYISATRSFFKAARGEPGVTLHHNPADPLAKPRRAEGKRRPLTPQELTQLWTLVQTTGKDPELDTLLVTYHLLTGARRQGALRLTLEDVHVGGAKVLLHEKDRSDRWQPVPPSLIQALLDHAHRRGATAPQDRVLRYRDGTPLTGRRYDSLHKRVQRLLPWADDCKFDMHTLRVHTSAQIERAFSTAVSDRFLGHRPKTPGQRYVQATYAEVATAIQALTGEPHPAADPTLSGGRR